MFLNKNINFAELESQQIQIEGEENQIIEFDQDQADNKQVEIFNFDEVSSGDDKDIEDEMSNQQAPPKQNQNIPQVQNQQKKTQNVQKQMQDKNSERYIRGNQEKRDSQFEPGLNLDDGSELPQLEQLNNYIKYNQDSYDPSIMSQTSYQQKGQQNNVVVMKQRIIQQQQDEQTPQNDNDEIESQVDFQQYQESNRDEPQIVNQNDQDYQQSERTEETDIPIQKHVQFNQLDDGIIDESFQQVKRPFKKPSIKLSQEKRMDDDEERDDDEEKDDDPVPQIDSNSIQVKSPFPPKFDISTFPTTLVEMKHFLNTPITQGVTLQCFIKRSKSGLARLYPVYHLYTTQGARYMLSAKKIVMNSTSNYIICMQKDNLSTKSENYLGKVKSNFMGTEFMLFDNGINPKKTKNTMAIRNQLGVIYYESNLLSNKGPRKMRIVVPKVNPENNIAKQYMPLSSKTGIQYDYKYGKHEFLDVLVNKPPRWNENIQAYVLNFYGRVDKPSVKNFQLIRPQSVDSMQFQFGRVDDLNFNLDFTWPFSPLQAMQICVSSFDFKFACE